MHAYFILASFDVRAPTAPAALGERRALYNITLQLQYNYSILYYIDICIYICI